MKKALLAQCLTYAGVLPFLGAAIMPAVKSNFLGLNYDSLILTYGAVIASFVAGIHWGIYLFKDAPLNLFIHSNVVALLAWCAVMVAHPTNTVILLICFLYLIVIDRQLWKAGVIEKWYLRTRLIATTLVLFALLFYSVFQ